MHHLYPLAKGDPLCPLGFHPQVRWPTRCKRCFRDYKEHGGKKRDEEPLRKDSSTASTPSLSSWGSRDGDKEKRRSWASSTNLAQDSSGRNKVEEYDNPSSWISTPDLGKLEDDTQANIPTVSLTLPKRKPRPIESGHRTVSDSFSVVKQNVAPTFSKTDSLATRAKKLKAIKEANVQDVAKPKRIQIKEVKTISNEPSNNDVQFLIQVKTTRKEDHDSGSSDTDDTVSIAGTETTDTTLVDPHENELRSELESMRQELEATKTKCERLEREKSDILLRRLAAMETTTSKTTASEVLKLQQKCNDLQTQVEEYRDEKRSLGLRVKELESEMETRPTAQQAQKVADELRSKLLAAETLCEELMDENEDMKKELRDLEEQMDEMQDNFREDQAIEYTSLKKELEQTTKNCRILSFKLRKTERRTEQLEVEKSDLEKKLNEISGGQSTLERIKTLEQELKVANEVCVSLQKELTETNDKLSKAEDAAKLPATKKKAPMLGSIGKITSTDGKPSRESLTRGGSQDDPAQLLRDLQDSMEREADLREQLKFAEEEAQNLRKTVSRIEDDNESLVLQLKKMVTQSRSRKLSPTNSRLTPESSSLKEGKKEEEDPAEMKLLLELNEQEATVLRKKVEELEIDNERLKTKMKEIQDKLNVKVTPKKTVIGNEKGNNTIQDKKIKVLEEEANELRKKLIEKERDCERLHAEISLNQKRSKGIQKSKSLDLDQQTLDLKRQLQVIEQEAAVLRSKVQSLESENEKLSTENRKLSLLRGNKKASSKNTEQIASLESELELANKKIKELEEEMEFVRLSESGSNEKSSKLEKETIESVLKKIKDDSRLTRSPKKVSSLTPKDQLLTMVNDLEKEIASLSSALKHTESIKCDLEKELKNLKLRSKSPALEEALRELKEAKLKIVSLESHKNNLDKCKEETANWEKEYQKVKKDFEKSEELISQLKKEVVTAKQNDYKKKFEDLKNNVELKETELKGLKKELEEKNLTIKDLTAKSKKITDLENKIEEAEDKIKKLEKSKKEQIRQLENKIEEEKDKIRLKETEKDELTIKFNNETKVLNIQIEELNCKIKSLENIISSKNTLIQQLEDSLKKERENNSQNGTIDNKEVNSLRDQLNKSIANLSEVQSNLETLQKSKKTVENKSKRIENELKKEKIALEKKVAELEIDLQNEKKKIEVIKSSQQKEQKNRELELNALKTKIKSLELNSGVGNKKMTEVKLEYQDRIDKLEKALTMERQEYEELTAKYEILEEEHVVTKAKLVIEKETLNNQLSTAKHEAECLESELQKVKDNLNEMQNNWIKEKLALHEKLKEAEKKSVDSQKSIGMERNTLKSSLEQKQLELDQMRKEYEVINDQMEYLRKENDELKKKLDDYDKVHKIQRNISADSSAMEKEIRTLTNKLNMADRLKKADLAQCKLRYENQIVIINEEMKSLQNQVTRFKRERDTYKHMLEGAQKTIGDLKAAPKSTRESRNSVSYDELEESRTKIATLEQQISCMEDELSEARLESSKLKTSLVSERTTWEVKMSELHSRVNELEEEKILSSGRTKVVGLRTKMELAWQKEREEQQRLLQETATLARDLRQTLFEVERERDKERLEAKRKQEQLKKSSEEDHDENRRKLMELQCDLLELRDAHAKLRTTNEKLRREKERQEKEREELRQLVNGKKRTDLEEERKVNALIGQVEALTNLAPELFGGENSKFLPTPPRRTRSSLSRESSPNPNVDQSSPQIQGVLQRLIDATEELKRSQRFNEEDRERERIKRVMGMRRATSTEHEQTAAVPKVGKNFVRNGTTNSSLHRKSLSLEHALQNDQQTIWKGDDGSMSSMQSLDGASDAERWSKRDTSLDSRLSGGSTQSETVHKKKKKGLIGKLKKMTKSRSIDDEDPEMFSPTKPISRQESGSDVDEARGSKKDLKERLTGMFKRSGSSSRSNSLDRMKSDGKTDTSSTQRPLRASPAPTEKLPAKKK